MAGAIRSDPFRGASNLAGRSNVRTTEATKCYPRAKRICGNFGSAEPVNTRRRPMSTSLPGTHRRRTPRGRRGRHVRTERSAKARIHSRVALALPHSEGIVYKPPCGEIAMCLRGSSRVRTRQYRPCSLSSAGRDRTRYHTSGQSAALSGAFSKCGERSR